MGKVQSLKRLADLGFNTPKLVLELREGSAGEKVEQWLEFYGEHQGKFSVRTERDGERNCPHYPNWNITRLAKEIVKDIKNGYKIYVFEPIDPGDCIARGNICHYTGSKGVVVEWIEGPGTVRDLETKKVNNFHCREIEPLKFAVPIEKWRHVAMVYIAQLPELHNWILEWSIYDHPVGQLREHEVYWELRPWQ